jgi:hypothetical protein
LENQECNVDTKSSTPEHDPTITDVVCWTLVSISVSFRISIVRLSSSIRIHLYIPSPPSVMYILKSYKHPFYFTVGCLVDLFVTGGWHRGVGLFIVVLLCLYDLDT